MTTSLAIVYNPEFWVHYIYQRLAYVVACTACSTTVLITTTTFGQKMGKQTRGSRRICW